MLYLYMYKHNIGRQPFCDTSIFYFLSHNILTTPAILQYVNGDIRNDAKSCPKPPKRFANSRKSKRNIYVFPPKQPLSMVLPMATIIPYIHTYTHILCCTYIHTYVYMYINIMFR